MAYSRITGARNGAQAIQYARGYGKGHNNKKTRNEVIGEVNMFPESVLSYEKQMQRYWNIAAAKNKNQVRRIVQSFSRKELNPDDPVDIQLANEIGQEFTQKAYPGHQAIVFTQIDGESSLIHNHVLVNNVNMKTGYGCSDDQTKFWYVKKWTNEVAGQYFELDTGQNTKDKTKQNERRKRQENEQIREENRRLPPEKRKPLKYIWKDDLKERITLAADVSISRECFLRLLNALDVSADIRQRKDGTEYIVYTLNDEERRKQENAGKEWKAKGHKLGTEYDLESLDERFEKERDRWDKLMMTASEADRELFPDMFRYHVPAYFAKMDKSTFAYKLPKDHQKFLFLYHDTEEEDEQAIKKAEQMLAAKKEQQLTEESAAEQEEENPLLREDVRTEQPKPTTFESAFEKMSITMKQGMTLAATETEKEPEKVKEVPKPKAAPVKKEAEKQAVKVPETQETKQQSRPRTRAEQLMIQKMEKRWAEEKKAKAEAQRAAFQKDKRPLPYIDWSKGNGHDGMEF